MCCDLPEEYLEKKLHKLGNAHMFINTSHTCIICLHTSKQTPKFPSVAKKPSKRKKKNFKCYGGRFILNVKEVTLTKPKEKSLLANCGHLWGKNEVHLPVPTELLP